jgi:hypothetical protein
VTNNAVGDLGNGYFTLTVLTSVAADDTYINDDGDTMTGALIINNDDGVDAETMLTIGDSNDLDNLIVWGNIGIGTDSPTSVTPLDIRSPGILGAAIDVINVGTAVTNMGGLTVSNANVTTDNYVGILFSDNVGAISGASGQIGMKLTDRTNHYGDISFATRAADGYLERMVIGSRGEVDIMHTANENDDRTLELNTDAAGFGDVKALDVVYTTGAIAAGEDEGVILINIDETAAGGGDIFGVEILSTDGGTAVVYGMKAGATVGPIHQDAGTFANPTTGTDNTTSTDVPNMIDGSVLTTTAIFENNSEYILIGAAAAFQEIEFIITTPASNPGIKPTFGYSIAGAHTFTAFSPVDGTNGFRNTGVIAWDASDLTSHTTNDNTGTYDILITRTQAVLGTSPVLGYAKTAATTEYIWDKAGDVNVKSITEGGVAVINATEGGAWTGTHDFGGAVLEIPNSATLTDPAGAGQIGIDTTTDQLNYYGTANRIIPYFYERGFVLENPAAADDDVPFWHPHDNITITDVYCETQGGTSVEVIISDGTNVLETITCDADGQADDGSIANGTFTANERMEFDIGTVTGSVDWVAVTITYVVDAD